MRGSLKLFLLYRIFKAFFYKRKKNCFLLAICERKNVYIYFMHCNFETKI